VIPYGIIACLLFGCLMLWMLVTAKTRNGVLDERTKSQAKSIENTQKAHEAADTVKRTPPATRRSRLRKFST